MAFDWKVVLRRPQDKVGPVCTNCSMMKDKVVVLSKGAYHLVALCFECMGVAFRLFQIPDDANAVAAKLRAMGDEIRELRAAAREAEAGDGG